MLNNIATNEKECKRWTRLNAQQINQLFSVLCNSEANLKREGLLLFLCKLKTGYTNKHLGTLFNVGASKVQYLIAETMSIIETHFVPRHLGFGHLNRELLLKHKDSFAQALYCQDKPNNLVVIFDSTYIYIQKSQNYMFQRKTYSDQKKRNFLKPMMVVTADGYILDVFGLYPATVNDAKIMESIIDTQENLEHFRKGDVFLLDRGFRDAVPKLNAIGFDVRMSSFLHKKQTQLDWREANNSRIVTKIRQVVERTNNRLKQFKLLKNTYCNKSLRDLHKYVRIAIAIINFFQPALKTDQQDWTDFVKIIEENKNRPNDLARLRFKNRNIFTAIDQSVLPFPHLSLRELRILAIGNYQIKQAISYYGQYIKENGTNYLKVARVNNTVIEHIILKNKVQDPLCIQGEIGSRFQRRIKHKILILIDLMLEKTEAIVGYYCTCKNGQRTVGMCSHVMTIIWYLSYARYMQNLKLSGDWLMNILKD